MCRRGPSPILFQEEAVLLKIGDFSQLGQVSVRTLHHYDERGLLKPAETDDWTGYRFYSYGDGSLLFRADGTPKRP